MATLAIAVTNEDIQHGYRNDPCLCPVALAAIREILSSREIVALSVHTSELYCWQVSNGKLMPEFHIKLPEEVGNRIATYDRTGRMEPFSFEIEVPD